MSQTINLFMWGYQPHFRSTVRIRARNVLERLGLDVEPVVFLVGVRRAGVADRHPICIEPEDAQWTLAMFKGLEGRIEQSIRDHPDQLLIYGDEASMRDKPERIRRRAISDEIRAAVEADEQSRGLRTFCSTAVPHEGHYVVVVVQVPQAVFTDFPSISYSWQRESFEGSLLISSVHQLLAEAEGALTGPDPGRMLSDDVMRSASEIVLRGAERFMRIPFVGDFNTGSLFDIASQLSRLLYEGQTRLGSLILAKEDDSDITYMVKLAKPVPLHQARWVRKLLHMASDGAALIIGYDRVRGIGWSKPGSKAYCFDMHDQHQWDFRHGDRVLMRVRFGEPMLPQEVITRERFIDNVMRLFPGTGVATAEHLHSLYQTLAAQPSGSMLMIAQDASAEADRLHLQGTLIEPAPLTTAMLERISQIDGTILADPAGTCVAIGVILDGAVSDECQPARGSRYNSAVRYVAGHRTGRMAMVFSDDRTIDILPLLRPRLDPASLEVAIRALTDATSETYYAPRNFLDDHRFYLNQPQCDLINAALERIDNEPQEVGRLKFATTPFAPDPEMDDTFFIH